MRGPRLAQLKFTGIITLTFAAGLLAAGILHLPTRSLAQDQIATRAGSHAPLPGTAALVDLSNAFASLGTTPSADRAGALGTIDPPANNDYYKFFLNAGQSASLAAHCSNR